MAAGADNCLFSAEPRDIVITRSPPLHRIPTLLLALYTLPNPGHAARITFLANVEVGKVRRHHIIYTSITDNAIYK